MGSRLWVMSSPLFQVVDLHARPATDDLDTVVPADILRGLNITVNAGEVHAIMGPNGCGKSTLASCLLASPEYEVTSGQIFLHGDEITDCQPTFAPRLVSSSASNIPKKSLASPLSSFCDKPSAPVKELTYPFLNFA